MVCISVFSPLTVLGSPGTGKAYTYDHKDQATAIPDPYEVKTVLNGDKFSFSKPVDMLYKGNELYILNGDTSGKIVVLNEDFTFNRFISFIKDGKPYKTQEPKSLWIDSDETILVADRSRKLVFRITPQGEVIKEYEKPKTDLMDENTDYLPYKVITDRMRRIYIMSEGEYRGIIQLDKDGEFVSFFGAKSVAVTGTLLIDMLWRNFMTEAQIKNSKRYLPVEYNNMTIDDRGFIYTTSGSASQPSKYISKINSKGSDVLDSSGNFGDYNLGSFMGTWYKTNFKAITVDDYGYISVLDKTWNRIFQYSREGELLYVLGGNGSQEGTFSEITEIISKDDKLLVCDISLNNITVLKPTSFGKDIRKANLLFESGLFQESIQPWKSVLKQCSNYEAAYVGIGKSHYVQKQYKEAMKYYKLGYSKADYSQAFQRYRSQVMRDSFPTVMTFLVVALVAGTIILRLVRKKFGSRKLVLDESGKILYLFHVLAHPSDGYQELRYNKKYSLFLANFLALSWFIIEACYFNYRGFIFNNNTPDDFNLVSLFATTVGMGMVFCLCNWLLSTFFEGKGGLKQVWIYFCYALAPVLAAMIIEIFLSRVLTLDESMFINYIHVIGLVWTVLLIMVAMGQLHQYSLSRNIFSLVASVIGIFVVLFLVFLMYNLFIQFKYFIESFVKELLYRSEVGF